MCCSLERLANRKHMQQKRIMNELLKSNSTSLHTSRSELCSTKLKASLLRDRAEVDQIRVEEMRLIAVKTKTKARPNSKEARQCDLGFRALQEQKETLWKCIHEEAAKSAEGAPKEEAEQDRE